MEYFRIKNKIKKSVIGFFCLMILFIAVSFFILPEKTFSQERPLEIEYPEIKDVKPETVDIGIIEYVKYVFNFAIVIVSLIAFGVLIIGGAGYVNSAGNPEKLAKAKQKIKSGLLGILILLTSYLILYTINPQLVIFDLPELIKLDPYHSELPEVSPPEDPTILGRIAQIAQDIKIAAGGIEHYSEEILNLTENCDCQNVWSICLVSNYYGACEGTKCYFNNESHPCPDWHKIKIAQQNIIAFKKEILYYKNKISAEKEDLEFESVELEKQVDYYLERIEAEEQFLSEIPSDNDGLIKEQERKIEYLDGVRNRLNAEHGLNLRVIDALDSLFIYIEDLTPLVIKLAEPPDSLVDSCWQGVDEICQPNCSGGGHDEEGCFSENCSGGNPCKADEIESTIELIKEIIEPIITICEDVFDANEEFKDIDRIDWLPPTFSDPTGPIGPGNGSDPALPCVPETASASDLLNNAKEICILSGGTVKEGLCGTRPSNIHAQSVCCEKYETGSGPGEGGETKKAWGTIYYLLIASPTSGGIPLRNMSDQVVGPALSNNDWCAAAMEGSVKINNDVYNYAGTKDPRQATCSHSPSERVRWKKTSHPYGTGNRNNPLRPFRSIATDPNFIPSGSRVYIEEAVGIPYSFGGQNYIHDGIFYADDVGGLITGNHLDFFIGAATGQSDASSKNVFRDFVTSNSSGQFDIKILGAGPGPDPEPEYSWVEPNICLLPYGCPLRGGGNVTALYASNHRGIDIAKGEGVPLYATADGTIEKIGYEGTAGLTITIDHGGGYKTRYVHTKEETVNVGDYVHRGDQVGTMGGVPSGFTRDQTIAWLSRGRTGSWTSSGTPKSFAAGRSTGAHIHYDIVYNGVWQNTNLSKWGICGNSNCTTGATTVSW